jgi:archaetidylinositol phosphate synthase
MPANTNTDSRIRSHPAGKHAPGVATLRAGEPFCTLHARIAKPKAARMALIRLNASVLGSLERPALAWMAARMPPWILPDHLTAFGVAGALLTATGFILSNGSLRWLWLACLGLLMNWVGDSSDGTLARYRHIERPRYGFFVDSTSDLFSHSMILLSVGLSPCAHFTVACLGLIAFLIGFSYTMIGAHTRATMRITYCAFGPTEIRALLLVGNLLTLAVGIIYLQPRIALLERLGPITTYDVGISILALMAVGLIPALAIREGRTLSVEDPPPGRARVQTRPPR